ncbi:MAG: hypothetical protein ACREU3_09350 [Steroidobacteraceae bacterium]
MRVSTFRRKWTSGTLITFAVAMVIATAVVMAEDFGAVHYDPKGDQLIVTVMYDGTNPNHHFSIQWGRCHKIHDQLHGPARKIIDVDILDDQGNDAAMKSYTEIVRVPLAGLSCRPATVTLWAPPNSSTSIDIP